MSLTRFISSLKSLLLIALMGLTWCSLANATSLRDPTLPGFGMTVSRQNVEDLNTGIVLKSIIHSDSKASAVINDRILYQGDSIQGVTVREIGIDKVVLSDGRILALFKAITEEVGK